MRVVIVEGVKPREGAFVEVNQAGPQEEVLGDCVLGLGRGLREASARTGRAWMVEVLEREHQRKVEGVVGLERHEIAEVAEQGLSQGAGLAVGDGRTLTEGEVLLFFKKIHCREELVDRGRREKGPQTFKPLGLHDIIG